MKFRKAKTQDIEVLIQLRKKQLQDEGQIPDTDIDEDLQCFFAEKMDKDELAEWVAEDDDGEIIATAALLFMDYPPAFNNPQGRKAYVTNVYTADSFRGQGIAGKLLGILEDEARKRGIRRIILNASAMGKKVYAKNGYAETGTVMEKEI